MSESALAAWRAEKERHVEAIKDATPSLFLKDSADVAALWEEFSDEVYSASWIDLEGRMGDFHQFLEDRDPLTTPIHCPHCHGRIKVNIERTLYNHKKGAVDNG